MAVPPTDDLPHAGAGVEEWLFTAWTDDGRIGVISGHRLIGRRAWYWSALGHEGHPMLHLTEWDVKLRADPFVVKAPEMWAEHHCVAPMQQWSVGNEAYAVALDDPEEALGRGYGTPTPMAMDLEWYATSPPAEVAHGYEQAGVVHGLVDLVDRSPLQLAEVPAHRWHRWTDEHELPPIEPEAVVAHTGVRTSFSFPDGSVADWVLTPRGWRSRARRR